MDNGNKPKRNKLLKLHAKGDQARRWLTPLIMRWIEQELADLHGHAAWLPPTTYLWEPDGMGRLHKTTVGISWEVPTTPPVHTKIDEIGHTFRSLPVLSQMLILRDLFPLEEWEMMVAELYVLPRFPTLEERKKLAWQLRKSMTTYSNTTQTPITTRLSAIAWLTFGMRWTRKMQTWPDQP